MGGHVIEPTLPLVLERGLPKGTPDREPSYVNQDQKHEGKKIGIVCVGQVQGEQKRLARAIQGKHGCAPCHTK